MNRLLQNTTIRFECQHTLQCIAQVDECPVGGLVSNIATKFYYTHYARFHSCSCPTFCRSYSYCHDQGSMTCVFLCFRMQIEQPVDYQPNREGNNNCTAFLACLFVRFCFLQPAEMRFLRFLPLWGHSRDSSKSIENILEVFDACVLELFFQTILVISGSLQTGRKWVISLAIK